MQGIKSKKWEGVDGGGSSIDGPGGWWLTAKNPMYFKEFLQAVRQSVTTDKQITVSIDPYVKNARAQQGMAEDSGDSQITPGMKTQYGTVVSVEGNTVTVKASNGDMTTVNIHDIQQGMAEGYVPINVYKGGGGGGGGSWEYDRGNPMVYGDNFISKAVRGVKRMQGKDPYGRDARVHYDWDTIDNEHRNIVSPENYWSREYRDAVESLNQAKKELADDPTDKYSNHKDNIKYYTNHIAKIKELLASNGVAVPPVAEGDNMSTFEQDRELAEMLKYAGVPVKESVLTDSTGSTLEHIKDTFRRDVKDFTQSGDMSDALYDALYDYYFDDMPYGTKKARDGDPHEWISDRFAQDIGLDEGWKGALAGGLAGAGLGSVVPGLGTLAGGIAGAYAGHKIGDQGISDPSPTPAAPGAAAPQRNAPIKISAADRLAQPSGPRKASFQKTVAEGSCNMTMEGSYCPEHGLAECGSMYEGNNDPINSNSAMTGSYYEGKETDIQEGDALLARIKSLALLR